MAIVCRRVYLAEFDMSTGMVAWVPVVWVWRRLDGGPRVTAQGDAEEGKGGFERECVVCQEDFGQERVMTLPCGHIFHKGCVRPWLEEHATCPTYAKPSPPPDK
jgi:hypothetical protein